MPYFIFFQYKHPEKYVHVQVYLYDVPIVCVHACIYVWHLAFCDFLQNVIVLYI